MNRNHLLAGALALLGIGLTLNGIGLILGNSRQAQPVTLATPAHALSENSGTGYYILNNDTYVLTSSDDGTDVYLWYYDYSPMKGETSIDYVTSASSKR